MVVFVAFGLSSIRFAFMFAFEALFFHVPIEIQQSQTNDDTRNRYFSVVDEFSNFKNGTTLVRDGTFLLKDISLHSQETVKKVQRYYRCWYIKSDRSYREER